MAVSISWTASGLWAWFRDNPGALKADRIKALIRKAQRQAIIEWTKMGAGEDVGLGVRFSERAFALLGLTDRSASYRGHQMKRLGKWLPYTSPQGSQYGASGTMRNEVLGGGTSIISKNDGGDTVTTQLSITGARILNLPNPKGTNATYRSEFLAFDAGGQRDATWITNRANDLAWEWITADIRRAVKRSITKAAA